MVGMVMTIGVMEVIVVRKVIVMTASSIDNVRMMVMMMSSCKMTILLLVPREDN